MAILNDNEFVESEGRSYANPQTTLDESNSFIENLRNTQQANSRQIQTDTYNLGTAVPSNLGGLTSPVGEGGTGDAGLSYFTSRFQTPQANATVANLRATAQAAALSQALQNEQEIWKNRYQQAYRNYQKRQYDKANTPKTQNPGTTDSSEPDVEKNVTTPQEFFGVPGAIVSETDTHYIYTDPKTGEQTKVSKDYMKQIYDENGNITDDGMVILDARRMLGL